MRAFNVSPTFLIVIAIVDSYSISSLLSSCSLTIRQHSLLKETITPGQRIILDKSRNLVLEVSPSISGDTINEVEESQSTFHSSNEVEESQSIDHSSILDFASFIENKRPGKLHQADLVLLRGSVSSVAQEKSENGDEIAFVAQRLLFRLITEWIYVLNNKTESEDILTLATPTINDFVCAMKLWEDTIGINPKSRNTSLLPTAVANVITIYESLIDLYDKTQQSELKPNTDFFRIALRTLSTCRERGIDDHAWRLFKRMRQQYGIEPDPEMFHSMIFIAAKSRDKGAAPRAEKLLREAVEKCPPHIDAEGNLYGMKIDSFNVVLTAWAKSGMDYGPERAEKLIAFIEEVDKGRSIIKPTASSFTSLIDAYAQTNEWDSVSHGERIFNRVLDLFLDGDEGFEPSIVSWSIMISAWARLSKKGNRGAASRADKLLRRMESLHLEGRIGFAPDAIVYVTCMNAHAFSKTIDGAKAAQEILNEMNERYMDGDDSFRPSAKSIKSVIEAWIRHDKMQEAELLLEAYEDHLDNIGSPNGPSEALDDVGDICKTILFGWAKNGDPEKAQETLLGMIERKMRLDSFCFDKIIEAYTQINDRKSFKRSYEVFETMEKCRLAGSVKPNERVYTSFIRAMTKAHASGMAQKSRFLLRRMEQLYKNGNQGIKPTLFTYNAILLACAESVHNSDKEEKLEALKIAVEMFTELRQGKEGPDHVSFGNMLRCANLLPDGAKKDALVSSTFQLCCKYGFVNQFVIRDLRQSASDELWESIFKRSKDDEIPVERLPIAWRLRYAK